MSTPIRLLLSLLLLVPLAAGCASAPSGSRADSSLNRTYGTRMLAAADGTAHASVDAAPSRIASTSRREALRH